MSIAVPYLSEYEIECAASLLLREVGLGSKRYCTNIVPVESILERHLKLSLDFDDLHTKLGVPISDDGPEILGAIWIESREVFIDQSLDPDANPAMEGRFRFTVGHEIGHGAFIATTSKTRPRKRISLEPCRKGDRQLSVGPSPPKNRSNGKPTHSRHVCSCRLRWSTIGGARFSHDPDP
jgi:hypothetical protein